MTENRETDDTGYDHVDAGDDPGDHGHADEAHEPDDVLFGEPDVEHRHRRLQRRRGFASCLVVLVVMGAIGAGAALAVSQGLDKVRDLFAGPADYTGDGQGSVLFEVKEGETSAQIAASLETAGVVKSAEAFTDRANERAAEARGIQPGFYRLREEMSADSALDVLVNPDNLVQSLVTVPEGARIRSIVDAIVKRTDIKRAALVKALAEPSRIGLPKAAGGNPEGWLFPATYPVGPKETAVGLLSTMVEKGTEVAADIDVASGAERLGLTTEEVYTVASILEYEVNRSGDYRKVARVIYNRLDRGMPLQMDSTVTYAAGRTGDPWTTAEERASDSLYNTYKHKGLPPGPIGSPGEETLKAALNPAEGDWLYFVPDFENDRTLFTSSYQQHLRNVEKAKEYCRTHEEC